MASIKENRKNGKIVSFKFRVFIGRDDKGKQQFKTKVWKPDKEYTEKKLIKLAEAEANIWEREIMQGVSMPIEEEPTPLIKFNDFVNNEWLPYLKNDECRITTYEFRTYILQTMLPFFGDVLISDVDTKSVSSYIACIFSEIMHVTNQPLSIDIRSLSVGAFSFYSYFHLVRYR